MAAYLIFTAKLANHSADNLAKILSPTADTHSLGKLAKLIDKIQGGLAGATAGFSIIDDSGTEPAGTITVTAAGVTTASSLTFTWQDFDIVFTAGTDFTIDTSDDDTQAQYLLEALQADPFLGTVLDFSRAANVITATYRFPGAAPEAMITMAENGTDFALAQIGDTAGVDGDAAYFFQGRKHP